MEAPSTARSSTASSNFVVCSQVRSKHRCRGGADLARTPSCLKVDGGGDGDALAGQLVLVDGKLQSKRKHAGGNPRQEWSNHKFATFKTIHAPDRKLSEAELSKFREMTSDEKWNQLSEEEVDQWRLLWRAAVSKRKQGEPSAVPAPSAGSPSGIGLSSTRYHSRVGRSKAN